MENQQQQQQPAHPPQPPPYQQQAPPFHHLLQTQNQQLQMFWSYQRQEVAHASDFRNHQLPLARIKKIMKADEDVRMISAEAPVLFAKACELFILELTIRSWLHAEENKRRTLQKNDVAAAIARTDIFDFLVDIVPRDEAKDEATRGVGPGAGNATGVPYYFPPMGNGCSPWGDDGAAGGWGGDRPGCVRTETAAAAMAASVAARMPVDSAFSAGPGMDLQQADAGPPPAPNAPQ